MDVGLRGGVDSIEIDHDRIPFCERRKDVRACAEQMKLVADINSGSRRGLKDGFVHDF